jgi:hypothetical protein
MPGRRHEHVNEAVYPFNCLGKAFGPTVFEPSPTKTVPKPDAIADSGLLRARSRFPEIVENIEYRGKRMELLECPNALAKREQPVVG